MDGHSTPSTTPETLRVKSPDEMPVALDALLPAPDDDVPPTPLTYRPDVDGLRTLAVIPVLLFHAYPAFLPGGFIGVDVFFVISGFLISGILFKEHQRGSFTYTGFYARRVRRIFPTLLVVLIATFWLGYLYLMAPKVKAMAATMLAGSLFSANLQVLSLTHSYFDIDVKTNPLLHLWSLGVEEQFYIFWPLFASLLMRMRFKTAIVLQVMVLVVSFATNVCFIGYNDNNKMSFYMPLSRFWQMSMGGLLAYLHMHGVAITSRWGRHLVAIVGLASVVVGLACIDETSAFPGYYALLPTVGATLSIAAGADASVNTYLLSNRVVIYVGKISYCLYLWHWPLLVFAIERYPDVTSRPFYMQPYAMLLLSLVLSIATYEDLEGRLRRHRAKWVTPLLVVGMFAVAVVAGCAYKNPASFSATEIEIANAPLPPIIDTTALNATTVPRAMTTVLQTKQAMADGNWNVRTTSCAPDAKYITAATSPVPFPFKDPVNPGYPERCEVINPGHEADGTLVVLGDSHADMSVPRFMRLFDDAVASKTPFPTIVLKDRWGRAMLPCRPEFAQNMHMLAALKPQAVLLVVHWIQFINPGAPLDRPYAHPPKCCLYEFVACNEQNADDVHHLFASLEAELHKLSRLGIKVFVVDQSPEYPQMVPDTWVSGSTVKVPARISRSAFRKEKAWFLDPLHAAVKAANATLLDYADNYSDGDTLLLADSTGYPTMCGGNHLNARTSRTRLTILDQVVAAARASLP
ncbi:hypothetical protein SDRG_13975 [Saprolegnia diclina VS20]|uniref:Acyltransferase 3 domain-containing protein n=1 Tax=Saprolegnia diclina (strain VS20) TaxID=1156394 RepID=T0Q4D2_SAPDV|nr:hypothetical protein SDRG_13975 [Saprolegnia diclina VS20]EQC28295.1 hypothetical protein SDRG_13975 [Saprolegnia diclina VS20]|eukprot:XP_008618299.1 hypothetical protein SDRG_13975 [Saprolegnia diclina VS20]